MHFHVRDLGNYFVLMQLRRLYPDFFASKHNLLLAFATDGMCPWVDKKSMSFWSKLYLIMNLPFYQRWRLANIIVSGLSHNSVNGQPRNFNTHHRVSAEDLLVGWEIGFHVLIDGVDVTVRVMMACVIGDGPGRSCTCAPVDDGSLVQVWPTC